ncbi:hypothetical protein BASA81_009835 [Batrachochytrium salamandrivorans]|nr:hypothetical protein BASA81_009835 [Batrachochytrium salamandrivorans]
MVEKEMTLRLGGLSDDALLARLDFRPVSIKITSVSAHHLPFVFSWLCAHQTSLRHVEFTNIDFGCQLDHLAPVNSWLGGLVTLGLNRCRLRPAQLHCVLRALSQAGTDLQIETLNLSANPLGNDGAVAVARFLETNHTLKELYAHRANIGDVGSQVLFRAVAQSGLETLNFQNNRLGELGALELAGCNNLHLLVLAANGLGNQLQALLALAGLLEKSTRLQYLDLSDNAITSQGIAPLLAALEHNSSLQSLLLSGNLICNQGAEQLAQLLVAMKCSGLQSIDLAINKIGQRGAQVLRQAIRDSRGCSQLVDVGLGNNSELDRSTMIGMQLTVTLAGLFGKVTALRSAVEVPRLGAQSALRRLPRELCVLVLRTLAPTQQGLEALEDEE